MLHGRWSLRAATVTLGVAAAVAICLTAVGAATRAPQAPASEPPAAFLVTRVLHDVRAHSGQSLRVAYRIDDEAAGSGGGSVVASLTVETPKGSVVRVLVRGRQAPLGVAQEWRGRLRLPAGKYLLLATPATPPVRQRLGRSRRVLSCSGRCLLWCRRPPACGAHSRGRPIAAVGCPWRWWTVAEPSTACRPGGPASAPASSRRCCWSRTCAASGAICRCATAFGA